MGRYSEVIPHHDPGSAIILLYITQLKASSLDSFGTFEGFYLSLRVGAQESVNSSVEFVRKRASYQTTSDTAGCPANSVGKFQFTANLSNLVTSSSLTDVYVEIAKLTNGNLLLAPGGG